MREINFRAWNKNKNKMFKVTGIDFYINVWGVPINEDYDTASKFPWSEVELLQYTGHNDKNDRKIYENDLVTHSSIEKALPVKWSEAVCGFVLEGLDTFITSFDNLELAGNIYENKDLLK